MINTIQEKKPLIHFLMHDMVKAVCANACLLLGASPLAAENPEEVEELTRNADAVYGNLGSQTRDRMRAMQIAREAAHRRKAPFVLDVSGVAASASRRRQVDELRAIGKIDVLKGNQSEILALADAQNTARGVDAEVSDLSRALAAAVQLTQTMAEVVVVSGAVDLITDGKRVIRVSAGHRDLRKVTGTGCISSLLCAVFATQDPFLGAAFGMRLHGATGAETLRRLQRTRLGIGFYYPMFLSVLERAVQNNRKGEENV